MIYNGSTEQFEFVALEDKPIIIKISDGGPKKDFNSIRAKLQSSLIAEDDDKQFVNVAIAHVYEQLIEHAKEIYGEDIKVEDLLSEEGNDNNNKKIEYVFKYDDGNVLYETIIIDNKVKFLKIIDGIPSEQDTIDLSNIGINVTLKPRDNTSQPLQYVFKDIDEVRHFIDLVRRISIEDLYNLVDSLCGKLLKISNKEKKTMITLDTIYSYFVDKFSTAHYDYFYAKPGSGKGAILAFLMILAYRCVIGAGFTGAALLDLLGSRGTCQISLLEDEVGNLQGKNADPFKIEIFKTGYDILGHTYRVLDGGTSGRNLKEYNTYGWKVLAAEDKLDNEDLEGLSDNTLIL